MKLNDESVFLLLGKAGGLKAGMKIHKGQHRDLRRFIPFTTPDHLKHKGLALPPIDTEGEKNSLYLYVISELTRVTQGSLPLLDCSPNIQRYQSVAKSGRVYGVNVISTFHYQMCFKQHLSESAF